MKKREQAMLFADEMLLRYSPFILLALLLAVFVYCAAASLVGCIDVIRYTIPAGAVNPGEHSAIGYFSRVGLLRHLSTMPASAVDSFARYVTGFAANTALAFGTVFTGLRILPQWKNRFFPEKASCDEPTCDDESV